MAVITYLLDTANLLPLSPFSIVSCGITRILICDVRVLTITYIFLSVRLHSWD